MNVENRAPVLRRKLAPKAAPKPDAEPAATGAAAGIRRAFARAVAQATPLLAEAGEVSRMTVSQTELLDLLDTDSFLGLLGNDAGDVGLALIDQSGFASVIEARTIGRLSPRAPVPRRPTATDASLLADLLEATLADLDDAAARSMRFLRVVADHRLLNVLIDDITYDFVRADFTLVSGEVQRPASVAFALPQRPATDAEPEVQDQICPGQDWSRALEAAVLGAPASLRAELGRITLPLAEVLQLGVGSTLTLPLSNLEDVRLVALDGREHAIGRLGQSRGHRAIRLTSLPGAAAPEAEMIDAAPPGAAIAHASPAPRKAQDAHPTAGNETPAPEPGGAPARKPPD